MSLFILTHLINNEYTCNTSFITSNSKLTVGLFT